MVSFKDRILKNLVNNGFPAKRVSLPLETLYEKADAAGENLNEILKGLESEGVGHEKGLDKIIFFQAVSTTDYMQKAQEMMSQMDPQQLREIQEKVMNMSPEEREAMMEQAKKMGLI